MSLLKITFVLTGFMLVLSCTESPSTTPNQVQASMASSVPKPSVKPHRYGGWYCPDNLNGFPPVDLGKWSEVPVIEGRMPTKEETQTEQSLIYVDTSKYPSAKVFDVKLPQLATYFCPQSNRTETIIVIQAFTVENDTIVGYRFLNGGNGSARWNEVEFVFDENTSSSTQKFVTFDVEINATQDSIWKVITDKGYSELFENCFKGSQYYQPNWRVNTNVNYFYKGNKTQTAAYANLLFGCYYIQNDFEDYSEKILLLEDSETKKTTMKMVCGPFTNELELHQLRVETWAFQVQRLVEGGC